MIQVRGKQIGAHTYKVSQLGALEGRLMLLSIIKLLGPGLAAAISSAGSGQSRAIEELIARGAGEALADLALRLDELAVSKMLDQLAKHTTVVIDGQHEPQLAQIFDVHFAGKYDELAQWAAFALEVNFSSFFGASGGLAVVAKRLKAAVQSSKSPSTSTGTSGASSAPSVSSPA